MKLPLVLDGLPGLCYLRGMYIRQTKTSNSATGEAYFTYRLVASVRVGSRVCQVTKLNLGRHFSLPKARWSVLCARLEALLSGQCELLPVPVPPATEAMAQRYYAQLVARNSAAVSAKNIVLSDSSSTSAAPDYQEIDVLSLELVQPRSVGVKHAGLQALTKLGLPEILERVGLNGIQRSCALGSIIGRLAAPGCELATWLAARAECAGRAVGGGL